MGAEIVVGFPHIFFTHPVGLQHAADGTGRLFVVEQAGRILVFPNSPDVLTATLFLDIQDRVNAVGEEEGLLGIAFHPDYETNGYFYVNYTAANPRRTVISRFSVLVSDPNRADPTSELVLLEFDQPFPNHNGGQLTFGPDGYLYIATGDGGGAGDPLNNGQNLSTLLGKILRIDVNGTAAGLNYSIPPDNPFVGTGFREEIYAYGLRNPWRFSFDPVTRELWAGDVGQDTREEIDIIESGKNYGWKIMEGSLCFSPSVGCNPTGLTLPIWEYGRDDGASVTGGVVYRGTAIPKLVGAYIYGDYVSGRIWALNYDGTQVVSNDLITAQSISTSSFGVDEEGEIYICGYDVGTIYKIVPEASFQP
jgi:glucose/arabinose dehydrogenase